MMDLMDNQLHELRVSYKDKTYTLSVRLRANTDNLIVFLHGWGGSKEGFAGAFSSDALKQYGICTIDLLGFGKSEKPADFSYDLLDQANVIALAVNSLKAKKIYLVGHSMGGSVGLLAVPLIKNVTMFINADSNLAPNGSGVDARAVTKQPFWIFKSHTLPLLKTLLRLHPRRSMRVWARWFNEASPFAMYRSIQSLVSWSDSGKLFPLFEALPHKAYIYGANGKHRKTIVPKLDKTITYIVPASGHALMTDNPDGFYATVAKIVQIITT
ncbi:MAG TPA: alpha/beta hydrolase [Candidatus Saccharimonadales bacterium]|nr:alpha/beta hydrolase [Candidatus Saccharimonadales bacterium]